MDDRAIGLGIRELRIRRAWRQADLASAAGISRGTISRIERGHLESVTLGALRRICRALDAYLDQRLRHPELDRLINRHHSAMHEAIARLLGAADGWVFGPEVSFSIYGERGVIDVLAYHPSRRIVLVIELKSDIVDVQDLIGSVDRKRRLALKIARQRGWLADAAAVWVVVADSRANRARVGQHASVLRAAFPSDGRAMAGWLADPTRPLSALSFLSKAHQARSTSDFARRRTRVRRVLPCAEKRPTGREAPSARS